MFIPLILGAAALAEDPLVPAPVSMTQGCEEILGMLEIGLPVEHVAKAVLESGLDPQTHTCLLESNIPDALHEAVEKLTPRASPREEARLPDTSPREEVLPPYARAPVRESPGGVPVAPTKSTPSAEIQKTTPAQYQYVPPPRGPDYSELRRSLELPDPAVATSLSGIVGFGAGHLYSQRPAPFAAFAVAEAVPLIAAIAAAQNGSRGAGTFYGLHLAIRLVDTSTAHLSAKQTSLEMIDTWERGD